MMLFRSTVFVFLFLLLALKSYSQSSHDLMLGGAFDFLKTDNQKLFDKAQVGFEANYFVIRTFTLTAGAEFWTGRNTSFVIGSRWYFHENFYARFRGLIGENDFSVGVGGIIPLDSNWRVELMGDFYFEGEFAVRTGVGYVIRLK